MKDLISTTGLPVLLLAGIAAAAGAQGTAEPPRQEVWLGENLAVSYAARIEGDWLVVDALHEPGWHTYAMDNVRRRARGDGKARPDTELPTVITPSPGIELVAVVAADGPHRALATRAPLVHLGLRGPLVLRGPRPARRSRRLGPGRCAGLYRPVVRDGGRSACPGDGERRAFRRPRISCAGTQLGGLTAMQPHEPVRRSGAPLLAAAGLFAGLSASGMFAAGCGPAVRGRHARMARQLPAGAGRWRKRRDGRSWSSSAAPPESPADVSTHRLCCRREIPRGDVCSNASSAPASREWIGLTSASSISTGTTRSTSSSSARTSRSTCVTAGATRPRRTRICISTASSSRSVRASRSTSDGVAGALPARPRPPPFFARELERLRVQELQRGRCVECHMIGDYRAAARGAGRNPRQAARDVPLAQHPGPRHPPRRAAGTRGQTRRARRPDRRTAPRGPHHELRWAAGPDVRGPALRLRRPRPRPRRASP